MTTLLDDLLETKVERLRQVYEKAWDDGFHCSFNGAYYSAKSNPHNTPYEWSDELDSTGNALAMVIRTRAREAWDAGYTAGKASPKYDRSTNPYRTQGTL